MAQMHGWPHYILVFTFLWQIGVCPNYCSCHHGVEELFAGSDEEADAHHGSHHHAEPSEGFLAVSQEHECDGIGRPAFLVSRTNVLSRIVACRSTDAVIAVVSDESLDTIRAFSSSRSFLPGDSLRESLRARSALQVWQV